MRGPPAGSFGAMSSHGSIRVLVRALTLAMLLAAGLSACKGRSDSAPDGQAHPAEFTPSARMAYSAGGVSPEGSLT